MFAELNVQNYKSKHNLQVIKSSVKQVIEAFIPKINDEN